MPFALCLELIPFLTRFAALQGGDSSYRAALLHEALYHQSVLPHLQKSNMPSLSKRDKQLLGYLEEGQSRQAIAHLLYVTENAIKSELSLFYRKLGVHSRNEALALLHKK